MYFPFIFLEPTGIPALAISSASVTKPCHISIIYLFCKNTYD